MTRFEPATRTWIERLGKLRNVIRQEIIARQLQPFANAGCAVLDVGCGQGTQAIRLARRGCVVTGVEPSPTLLATLSVDAKAEGVSVEALPGTIEDLTRVIGDRTFDLVLAHGLLMYLPETRAALATLAAHVRGTGHLSCTFRNAHALAMRPGLRGDWQGALHAFDSDRYVNELGLEARAHRIEVIERELHELGFDLSRWFGVRVFNDAIASDVNPPAPEVLEALLDAEEQAGARDPYRWMASQLHVIARRRV